MINIKDCAGKRILFHVNGNPDAIIEEMLVVKLSSSGKFVKTKVIAENQAFWWTMVEDFEKNITILKVIDDQT